MKASDVAVKLIENDRTDRPVYVILFSRDTNGSVLTKRQFPVAAVFSHHDDDIVINIEQKSEMSY